MSGPQDDEKIFSLPHLQNLIKRDPDAYEQEYIRQYAHFESQLEIFKLKPQKPDKKFHELVMFLAHASICYPKLKKEYSQSLITILEDHHQVLHGASRKTLVQSLVLLRNRNQFELLKVLPVYFKLFKCQDKLLRASLMTHIVKDLERSWKQNPSNKIHNETQQFFYKQLKSNDVEIVRKTVNILICLCQKKIWDNQRTVNQLSSVLLCPDVKCAAAAVHFFLGNKVQIQKEITEDSDATDDEVILAQEKMKQKGLKQGQKKTKANLKKLKKAQKNARKLLNKKDGLCTFDTISNYHGIDNIHDPHTLVDKLLKRVSKTGEPFSFRLIVLNLLCRIISRHHMIVLNVYPLLQRWLNPHQRNVTQVLACLAQACHELVPPEEVAVVIKHVMDNFVGETCNPEVLAIGINSIREICVRQPLALTGDQLADLVAYKKHKNKGVAMAARAITNLYRDVNPELLHASERGREANVAVRSGQVQKLVYGAQLGVTHGIDGAELLTIAKKQKGKKLTEDFGDEDDLEDVDLMGLPSADEEEEGQMIPLNDSDDEDNDIISNPSSDESVPQLVDEAGKPLPIEHEEDDFEEHTSDEEEEGSDCEEGSVDDEEGEEMIELEDGEDEGESEEEGSENNEEDEEEEEVQDGGSESSTPATMQDVRKANAEVRKARVALKKMQAEQKKQEAELIRQNAEQDTQELLTNSFLTSDDFEKIRKLRMKKAVEMRMGRKRTAEEAWLEESDPDDSDKEEMTHADEMIVTGDDIKHFVKKRRNDKQARIESIMEGRTDPEEFKMKKKKTGGKSNREHAKNKPHQMLLMKKKQRVKNAAVNRVRALRGTLKSMQLGKVSRRGGKHQNRKRK